MRSIGLPVRLGISAASGVGAAVVVALIVTVIDLYMTGHGYGSITREVITLAQAGVHLSIGDLGMLVAAIAVAVSTWYLVGHLDAKLRDRREQVR
jgi:hypothetical protein